MPRDETSRRSNAPSPSLHPSLAPPGRDVGRLVARALCGLLCLIGALPLVAAGLTRLDSLRHWAAQETTQWLDTELGIEAQFELELSVWPLGVELFDLKVASSDGGKPALFAPRLIVEPRIFSLFAGKLSAGHVSLQSPEFRVVLRDSQVVNLALPPRNPESSQPGSSAAFSSIAITDAVVRIESPTTDFEADAVDLDVFANRDNSYEIALRASQGQLSHRRDNAVDEDVLCQLDARIRVTPELLHIRRLSLLGATDLDEAAGTAPHCDPKVLTEDPHRLLLRLSNLMIGHDSGALQHASGHILLRSSLVALDRYYPEATLGGWVALSADLSFPEGATFPAFQGKVTAGDLRYDQFTIAHEARATVHVLPGQILVPEATLRYGDGEVTVSDLGIDLNDEQLPMRVTTAKVVGLSFPHLMAGLGITPNTIVQWDLDNVLLRNFEGTLSPLKLRGPFAATTKRFEVFDRAYHQAGRQHMIGVPAAHLQGTFGVHEDSIRFDDFDIEFGNSALQASVRLGFDNRIALTIPEGSTLSLADVSPLTSLEWSGLAHLDLEMAGPMDNPLLQGSLRIARFGFSGFPIGDFSASHLTFQPLRLHIPEAQLRSGSSEYRLLDTHLKFDTEAVLEAVTRLESDPFYLSDFFHMWHLDEDPRFAEIAGQGRATGNLRYVLGGPEDSCGSGELRVVGAGELYQVAAYGERYQRGSADFDFLWRDIEAGHLGMSLRLPSLTVHKGSGTIAGRLQIREGAALSGEFLASGIPLDAIQSLDGIGAATGKVDSQIHVGGTLDAMSASMKVSISPIAVGRARLPASRLGVELTPVEQPASVIGRTACGGLITAPYNPREDALDKPTGVFRVDGELFGGQAQLGGVEITRQHDKHLRGLIELNRLDLLAITRSVPALALVEPPPRGHISGRLAVEDLPFAHTEQSRIDLVIAQFAAQWNATEFELKPRSHLRMGHRRLHLDPTLLTVRTPGGQSGGFSVRGTLTNLGQDPSVDFRAVLKPADLGAFRTLLPNADTASGRLEGALTVSGRLAEPTYNGSARLKNAAIRFHGPPYFVDDISATLSAHPGELRLGPAQMSLGGGKVQVRASAPLQGLTLGQIQAFITARSIALPLPNGLKATADATLQARYDPSERALDNRRVLPKITGSVALQSLAYSLPVKVSADISDLAQRGKRTEFDAYQLDGDLLAFDVAVRALQPMRLDNNLINAALTIENDVLHVTGTNQRFGIRGALNIAQGGQVHLSENDFEIQQGRVKFDDPSRIVPRVDVTAVTEYRRYGGKSTSTVTTPLSGTNANVGEWRITMRAHGDAEALRIDLSSQPSLSEDDIFLLLTVGMTRAEMDNLQSGSIGETVALEALTALTGADQVVKEAIPVIDEFRFGSAYSPRTGRTERTVTFGKQLSQRIRASVTSSLGESRDVRSNVQVKLNNKVSVEGSYDNINDLSTSSVGNLGADVRWRLDFE